MAYTFHLQAVEIHDGIPVTTIQTKGVTYDNVNVPYSIDELKAALTAFTSALHTAIMIRDHCTKCEQCTMEVLGRTKAGEP